jgi:hypothetical protein
MEDPFTASGKRVDSLSTPVDAGRQTIVSTPSRSIPSTANDIGSTICQHPIHTFSTLCRQRASDC